MSNQRIYLSGNDWTMTYSDVRSSDSGTLPYTVPSNVEHSFMAAGLLPKDLYYAQNVRETEKYETYNYEFTKKFDCEDTNAKYRLVFEGVDTIAEYYLNGVKIGESDNMLVEHVFDVSNLKKKDNELKVCVYSTTIYNSKQTGCAYTQMTWNSSEYIYLRRAGHTYGWDIMPRIISAGIWKDVYLEKIKPTYIKDFYIATRKLEYDTAILQMCFEVESDEIIAKTDKYARDGKYVFKINGSCNGSTFFVEKELKNKSHCFDCRVENAKLWWPKGAGDQNLYDISVNLYKEDVLVDTYTLKYGIRIVKLLLEDENGNEDFVFSVNGEKLFMRGSNHVPLSPLHSEDISRVEKEFEIINDMQMNMIRCWGGNVYESDKFYDLADKNGVLIWQDFTFACNPYPMDDEFANKVKIEAEKVIKRLRNHPCIAIYAGDNEIDSMHSGQNINPETNIISREVLPMQVTLHDPYRDYLPSSPYITEKYFKKYPHEAHNHTLEQHLWNSRDWYKSPYYKDTNAKFVSEIGIHGCVTETSLKKFIPEDILNDRYDESWVLHSTDHNHNNYRIKLMEKHIKLLFDYVPKDYKEFCLLSEYAHSEGFKFYLENMRFKRPFTTGMLLWNHLDGWPQFSEAFKDYYFDKKLGYDVICRAYNPILMGVKETFSSKYQLVICNDTLENLDVSYRVYDGDTNEELANGTTKIDKNSIKELNVLKNIFFEKRLLIVEYVANGKKYYNHFITGFPTYTKEQFDRWYKIIDELK